MSSDEFDSSSTLYECVVFSKICFAYILSYIGISELACSASVYQLIGLYMSYRDLSWINFRLCYNFLCFVLGINSCTLCLMIAEDWNLKLHNNSLIYFLPQIKSIIIIIKLLHPIIYIYIYILYMYIYIIYVYIYIIYIYMWLINYMLQVVRVFKS